MMFKRFGALFAVLAVLAALVSASPAGAQGGDAPPPAPEDPKAVEESPNGSYLVIMVDDPVAAALGQEGVGSPAGDQMVGQLEASHDEVLREAGADASAKVHDYAVAVNGFSAVLSHDEAVKVAANTKVTLVIPDELRQLETDASPEFLGVAGPGGAWSAGVTGKGVVVGVIDSGIWPEHPSFADNGLPAPPVTLEDTADNPSCEFGNTAANPDDAPFTCNNKLIGGRQILSTYRALLGVDPDEFDSTRDDNGHGTHTASTAAGNADVKAEIFSRPLGTVSGIAPDAHIIAYKALGNQGGFASDLVSAIDQAVADGVDVINYSVGGGPGLASGDALAFLNAASAGVLVATSAGNTGSGAATIGGPADVPWITSVGANTQTRFFEGTIRLGNRQPVKGASVTNGLPRTALVDAEFAGSEFCFPGELTPELVEDKIVLCRRGGGPRIDKSRAVFEAGGAGMILYNTDNVGDFHTDNHWVPSIIMDERQGLQVKAYIASSRNPVASLETGKISRFRPAPSMTQFSSRGPNPSAADIIKPDITAPGIQILAGNSPFVDPGSVPGQLFQSIAGTSMSSPHVAGVYALIHQVHPDWTPAMAKSAIMTSADFSVRDNDRRTRATPFGMGSGQVDPGRVSQRGSAFNPGLVYDAGLFEYAAFTCGANVGLFTDESCEFLDGLGVPFDGSDLNYPSIGIGELAGTQTITRTVTSVADSTVVFQAQVFEPQGYDVTVEPRRIRLAPGESASFEVTITNDGSGPIDEWRFGSLTWRGAGYHARSPIAVRASLFDGPAAVIGEGTDGSTSFDVTFGYTGDYVAAPHGLAAEASTTGTVVQDPDQNFDPADGFSNAHTFDLSDAAFFRLALGQDAVDGPDVDIDIFVADPSGAIVAQSTAGGTSELVELTLPTPGTWTVYVHGWQTVDGESSYDLSTWTVPLTSGGSLSVDDAPDAATLSQSGTITISWSGLDAGADYVGAVSHSDGTNLLGLTLVEVGT